MAIEIDSALRNEMLATIVKVAKTAERMTLRAFMALGERCVREVRDRPGDESWYDRTGNLRSSVGYIVSRDGAVVFESDFSSVKSGSEGSMTGKRLAEALAKTFTHGYAVIVVAGMNYAEYVEAKANKDVLAGTELWARAEAPRMLEKLKTQILNIRV